MITEIKISKLRIHPKNVRKVYNNIDELADSIKAQGILQNLTVVNNPEEEGTYWVVIGNRRLTAAIQAGIETAPCQIVEMDEKEQAQTMLLENMQRSDLTIYEQSQGIQMVLDLGETEDGLSDKTGLSKTTIRHRVNIAKLNPEILKSKEQDDTFQLTLKDLYELEKIPNVKMLDKILKEATDSNNLAMLRIALLENLFKETYIRDIVTRNKIRNVGEMEYLLNILSSAIGSLTNPNKLQKTFKSVNNSKITVTTITKYIDYLEDSFLIEEAKRFDIKGKSYIGTPLKYYFMDMGLRNVRINFRQMEVTHSMENVIYNELKMRGYNVDVGNLTIIEKDKNDKAVKKQLEVDFICSKGSRKYYIQSAYMLGTEEKMAQEIRPFLKINDSFKKIVITSNIPRPFYTEDGILMMSVYDFLLNPDSLEL